MGQMPSTSRLGGKYHIFNTYFFSKLEALTSKVFSYIRFLTFTLFLKKIICYNVIDRFAIFSCSFSIFFLRGILVHLSYQILNFAPRKMNSYNSTWTRETSTRLTIYVYVLFNLTGVLGIQFVIVVMEFMPCGQQLCRQSSSGSTCNFGCSQLVNS